MNYIITEDQRDNFLQIMRNNTQDPDAYEAITEIESLPVLEGEPVNNAFLTTPEMAAFTRFLDTCEDGEGYDVPKPMMRRLSQIGVVRHLARGIYEVTELGQSVIDHHPAPFTPITAEDVNFEMVDAYVSTSSPIMTYQKIISLAVNAYLGAKK